MDRRRFTLAAASALFVPLGSLAETLHPTASFDEQLNAALADPDIIAKVRGEREGLLSAFSQRALAPRVTPSKRGISSGAKKLIIGFEVTDERLYKARYTGVVWPKGKSGPTFGIGYDIGYVKPEWLDEDWKGILDGPTIATLKQGCGVRGDQARQMIPQFRQVIVSWDDATKQFYSTSLPRFVTETMSALPNSDKLNDDCLGALTSLVYNRGASFKNIGDRYAEMRNIRLHMVNKAYGKIPAELRSMKHIWVSDPDAQGLVVRRELEAVLFDQGWQAMQGKAT